MSTAGWPSYDSFFIVLLSGQPVYDPHLLRPNPNSQKLVLGLRIGSNIDTPEYVLAKSFVIVIKRHTGNLVFVKSCSFII